MANRRKDNGSQIPQRVENAAQNMTGHTVSGPRSGYIPQDPGRRTSTILRLALRPASRACLVPAALQDRNSACTADAWM